MEDINLDTSQHSVYKNQREMKAIKHKMWHFGSLLRAKRGEKTHIFKTFEIL